MAGGAMQRQATSPSFSSALQRSDVCLGEDVECATVGSEPEVSRPDDSEG